MKYTVCVVGLGYVGLPLAHTFARKKYTVLGYDISDRRVKELLEGHDRTNELTDKQLRKVTITYSSDPKIIEQAAVILTVATPKSSSRRLSSSWPCLHQWMTETNRTSPS